MGSSPYIHKRLGHVGSGIPIGGKLLQSGTAAAVDLSAGSDEGRGVGLRLFLLQELLHLLQSEGDLIVKTKRFEKLVERVERAVGRRSGEILRLGLRKDVPTVISVVLGELILPFPSRSSSERLAVRLS